MFCFGSNLAGRHGAGAAKEAVRRWGAVYGRGKGLQADLTQVPAFEPMRGMSYAIPTKDERLRPLDLSVIQGHTEDFIQFANSKPNWIFEVTAIGCGLAGYDPSQIAPMFTAAPKNCILPPSFKQWVSGEHIFRDRDQI